MALSNKEKNARREESGTKWKFLIYPDSVNLPQNWREQIIEIGCKTWISPLHEFDVWSSQDEAEEPTHKAGDPKKAHYHIILEFEQKISFSNVIEQLKPIGVKYVLKCVNKRHDIRYLSHADSPSKHRYNDDDIECYNDALEDKEEAFNAQKPLTDRERMNCVKEMISYIRSNDITNFKQFFDYCCTEECQKDEKKKFWLQLIVDRHSHLVKLYIDGNFQEKQASLAKSQKI